MAKAALCYFGHMVRAGGMEDDVMLGRINGARKRGRPRQRWLDTLNGYASGATISNMRRDARDRAGWRGAATAVADATRRHKVRYSSSGISGVCASMKSCFDLAYIYVVCGNSEVEH